MVLRNPLQHCQLIMSQDSDLSRRWRSGRPVSQVLDHRCFLSTIDTLPLNAGAQVAIVP